MNIKAISTDALNKLKARDWKGIPAVAYAAAGGAVIVLLLLLVLLCSGSSIKSDEDFLAFYDEVMDDLKEIDKDLWRKAKSERADIVRGLKGDGSLGEAMQFALMMGSRPAMEYLINEKGVKLRDKHLSQAALGGHLDVVEYLVEEQGLKPEERTLRMACSGGHVDVCEYLVEEQQMDATKSQYLQALCIDKEEYKEAAKMLSLLEGKTLTVDDIKERHLEVAGYLVEQGANPKDPVLQVVMEKSDNAELNAFLRKEAK